MKIKRHFIQAFYTLLSNSYFKGFFEGEIYQGKLKQFCSPGLNCYSCPGALNSCPIGSLQAVMGSYKHKFSFYVIGFLMAVGALIGRLVCGFLCPFGLVQDLLNKIPSKKIKTFRADRVLRYAKYIILAVFVIILPLFMVDVIGQGAPYFCKLICPAGTLEGGIPLVLLNKGLRSTIGKLYLWKNFLLIITIISSIIIYRPFCKYICPLGAIYGLFNPISLFHYSVDEHACVNCGKCARVCPMGCNPVENANDRECIRCTECRENCPVGAIHSGVLDHDKQTKPDAVLS